MRRIVNSCLLFFALTLLSPFSASAAILTVPTGLNAGDEYRLAFSTSIYSQALSPLIADYNNFVTAIAGGTPELAGLGTTWVAIASTPMVDARDNTSTNSSVSTGVPIYRLDGVRIADNNADLWDGVLQAALNINQNGLLNDTGAWTGTQSNGLGAPGAELGTEIPYFGGTSDVGASWMYWGVSIYTDEFALYAISGVLTVVPEPSSCALGIIGLLGLGVWRVRRRDGAVTGTQTFSGK